MNTARASVLEKFKTPLAMRSFPVPGQLDPGAVLIRTEMAGVCGTDVHLWKGELPISLPLILGHETVGLIEALGEGVEKDWSGQPLSVGDRVTWHPGTSCGACFYCAEKGVTTRCVNRRAYGVSQPCGEAPHFYGGYAELHCLKPRSFIFKLPDDLPTEAVVGAGCALNTAIHGVERTGISWRDTVVVQGAGPVGIAALAVAKSSGAGRVIVIGAPKNRLEMAERFGADHVIDIDKARSPAERIAIVRELTRGFGADVVLECVGIPGAVVEGMEMCRDGGKYLILGHYCDAGPVSWNPHVVTRKQLSVFGSWSSEPRHAKMAIEFLSAAQNEFPFAEMVSHRFSLEQTNDALAISASGQSTKSVIMPGRR
jgi:threonine dehydrogenase-like Zn-dependent dehydrogenase